MLAIALALGIVGWLAFRAQRDAEAIDLPLTIELPLTTEPAGELLTLPAGLSSSKSLVIEPEAAEPSPAAPPRRTRRTVIRPLGDSKAGLIEPAHQAPADPALLFSSKSGPVPAVPPAPAPAPKPRQ